MSVYGPALGDYPQSQTTSAFLFIYSLTLNHALLSALLTHQAPPILPIFCVPALLPWLKRVCVPRLSNGVSNEIIPFLQRNHIFRNSAHVFYNCILYVDG